MSIVDGTAGNRYHPLFHNASAPWAHEAGTDHDDRDDASASASAGASDRIVGLSFNKFEGDEQNLVVLSTEVNGDVIWDVSCLTWSMVEELPAPTIPHTEFIQEEVNVPHHGTYVTFRARGTQRYLTAYPFGDRMRDEFRILLRLCICALMPDAIEVVLDFLVRPASPPWAPEGAGFFYHPMMAEPGPPNTLQLFRLEDGQTHIAMSCIERAIRTFYGAYLRCGPWGHMVSQSPLCQVEETWEVVSLSDDEDYEDDEDEHMFDS